MAEEAKTVTEPPKAVSEKKAEETKLYKMSASPHIHKKISIPVIMWTVAITLIPAGLVGIYAHGIKALWVILISVASAIAAEYICQKMRGVKITLSDGSAVVTGLLFAYVISCETYWYVVVFGAVFSIAIAKQAFGGLGLNIWNPALAGRAFVLASFGFIMTAVWPNSAEIPTISGMPLPMSGATPLKCIRASVNASVVMVAEKKFPENLQQTMLGSTATETWSKIKTKETTNYLDLFVGTRSGSLGETSALFLLLGGLVLVWRGYIKWYLPFTIFATIALLAWILPVRVGWYNPATNASGIEWVWFAGDPLFHLLAGGCVIGAVYMATDMVTSPITKSGKIIFGIGIGILTMVIRLYGGYPEGVSYAILIMNTTVPLIDRYTKPKVFGARK